MPGFVKGRKLKKMGMKAQDTAELFFEDVRLPKSSVLGQVNKGFYAVMQELPQERLLIADIAVASGEAVCVQGWRVRSRAPRTHVKACFGRCLVIVIIVVVVVVVVTTVVVTRVYPRRMQAAPPPHKSAHADGWGEMM
jgi:hypothetical protein